VDAAKVACSYAAAADLPEDVTGAEDSLRQTAAASSDSQASHKLHQLQAQPKRTRCSDSIHGTKVLDTGHGCADDAEHEADAASPFETHGAAYGGLLQVHQCSFSE
jgi:hypothetical protein